MVKLQPDNVPAEEQPKLGRYTAELQTVVPFSLGSYLKSIKTTSEDVEIVAKYD